MLILIYIFLSYHQISLGQIEEKENRKISISLIRLFFHTNLPNNTLNTIFKS